MSNKIEHPYAEWLRAIADGKSMQIKYEYTGWVDTPSVIILELIAKMDDRVALMRIKPLTIKIGNYEVASSIQKPLSIGSRYYHLSTNYSCGYSSTLWSGDQQDKQFFKLNVCWKNEEDIKMVVEALSKLLSGN